MNKVNLLTVMIPVYNEEECIDSLYTKLVKVRENINCKCEFLFINDGSVDNTLNILIQLQKKDDKISILDLSRNFGKEIAMTAGLDFMKGDTLVIIDADLQDNPDLLLLMIMEIENGYDDVYAQRISRKGETFMKKASSFLFYRILEKMSSIPIQKDTGDFRMLSSKAIEALRALKENERNMKGLFSFIGFKKKAIPYVRDERIAGTTKWNYFNLINLAIKGITAFSTKPLRIISVIGLIVSLGSFLFLIKVLVKSMFYGDPVAGYPSMMSAILLLGGFQLLSIGVLGEYLGIIFSETKKRPIYYVNQYYHSDNNDVTSKEN